MIEKDRYITNIFSPISLGELIDKITILEIKRENMSGEQLKNVLKELEYLQSILKNQKFEVSIDLFENLKKVNSLLWIIEDKIRIKEFKKEFDNEFVQLARSVYQQNDRRASIKREINIKYNSEITEEKSYIDYKI